MAVSIATFIGDVLFFIKNDLNSNLTDPISSTRGTQSKFVVTSYPQRNVKYPVITVKIPTFDATRAGMQTVAVDIEAFVEVRVWARNEKEKDELFTAVFDELRTIQFTASTGSIANNLHDFQMVSATEVDEEGARGIKSRVGQFSYRFFNVS